jgi:hypothetical protein
MRFVEGVSAEARPSFMSRSDRVNAIGYWPAIPYFPIAKKVKAWHLAEAVSNFTKGRLRMRLGIYRSLPMLVRLDDACAFISAPFHPAS